MCLTTRTLLIAAISSPAWADGSLDLLLVEPRRVPDIVWKQTIGFVELIGPTQTELQTWQRTPSGGFRRGPKRRLADLAALSSSGYHPPDNTVSINPSKLALLAVESGHVRLVIDPLRPASAWFREDELAKLPGYARAFFTNSPRRCCAQLLFLGDRVEVFDRPNAARPLRVHERKRGPVWLEVVAVRDGWVKVENHFSELTGKPPGFEAEPGWIRLRDDQGRLVFWFVNPDSC